MFRGAAYTRASCTTLSSNPPASELRAIFDLRGIAARRHRSKIKYAERGGTIAPVGPWQWKGVTRCYPGRQPRVNQPNKTG
jgi:hypothetical protein